MRLPGQRHLGETKPWEVGYTVAVIVLMFAALITDKFGADHVMAAALTAFLVSGIIDTREGLRGFSSEGLWTVMILFVVAEGIQKTGALDGYLTKLLGSPKSTMVAQLRLMIPIAVVSAFLNNTPIVVVMIPIVQRWARNTGIPIKQLLIPLSFASIFGGTCTLIGTSTNLVVSGLLEDRYPDDPRIGLFDLSEYGVPIAMAGITYVVLMTPLIFRRSPNSSGSDDGADYLNTDNYLLGARVMPWSPAVGRTVQRSGLRDTGGIFLVSVHRAATGNVHRAVSRDFVLNSGDILYFTGLVETFGEFCAEHGLEVVTSETSAANSESGSVLPAPADSGPLGSKGSDHDRVPKATKSKPKTPAKDSQPIPVSSGTLSLGKKLPPLSELTDEERLRIIHQMTDLIHGVHSLDALVDLDDATVVIAMDNQVIVIGIVSRDRPGLLLDISQILLRLHLQLRHAEAAVLLDWSVSTWRCEYIDGHQPRDFKAIDSAMTTMLISHPGTIEARKMEGLRVLRARVLPGSQLIGKTAGEVDFHRVYKAALVTINNTNREGTVALSPERQFQEGDILVLQVNNDSPLLCPPSDDFYEYLNPRSNIGSRRNNGSSVPVSTESNLNTTGRANPDVEAGALTSDESDDVAAGWRDLQVVSHPVKNTTDGTVKEFLTAMKVAPHSKLSGKTAIEAGLDKVPDCFLVSIDRPRSQEHRPGVTIPTGLDAVAIASSRDGSIPGFSDSPESRRLQTESYLAIARDEPLQESDILWFSGHAHAVGELRKIAGLVSYEDEEVKKINEKAFDRRLVQAVVARNGDLNGKTVKETKFRTRFGAAVIAVHREGKRVHDHPGNVVLRAGDVLLLEAGSSFIANAADHHKSFALFAEVKDSAPPRLKLVIPALLITVAMLACFTSKLAPLLVCGLVASILMVALGILSEQEARDAMNWEIFVTIGSAFGIGIAMINSGVAGGVAGFLVDLGAALGLGNGGLYGAVYLATFLISNVVTNNAAAALIFPIAMDAADAGSADRLLMCYSVMLGASASFMSPYGYQTNLLIYGPGGYKYMDFVYFGFPLQIVLWLLSTVFLSFDATLYSWAGTAIMLCMVIVFALARAYMDPDTGDWKGKAE